jgi:TolB-like protein/DNA-binding winged helix-turn-helix (wHTH) protein/Flp pilus assembly protein TadD
VLSGSISGVNPAQDQKGYAFGRFVLDVERGVLRDATGELQLRPKAFEVLRYLVERPGRLVSREELRAAIWGDTVVTDDVLAQCIGEIRRALGDAQRSLVSTVPRRGYRLELPVTPHIPPSPHPPLPSPHAPPLSPHPRPASPSRSTRRKLGRPLGQHKPARSGRQWVIGARVATWLIVALGLVLVLSRLGPTPAPGGSGVSSPASGEPSAALIPADPPAVHSIAVLPFVDLSAAGDQEHFGDGVAEEILNLLAQSPELKVIARTSSFAFKGRAVDIATIAAALGVAHVLEGSVRVADDRVRVTAQLISASDSTHVWSQSYDRALDDVLQVQREIAEAVAGVLHATLLGAATAGQAQGPSDIRAYDHTLRARYLFHRRQTGDLQRSVAHYETAIEADPGYAMAWAGLSGALNAWITEEGARTTANLARRREAAERALALDPALPEAHLRIVPVLLEAGEPERAEEHISIARTLDPDNLLLLTVSTGALLAAGRLEEADERWQRAIARDPLSLVYRFNRTVFLIALGRLDEARLELAVAAELAPGRKDKVALLRAKILLLEGRAEEALVMLQTATPGSERDVMLVLAEHALGHSNAMPAALERLASDESPDGALGLAEVYAALGEIDAAFRWLDEACERHGAALSWGEARCVQGANISPFLKPLHADPRWITMPADRM